MNIWSQERSERYLQGRTHIFLGRNVVILREPRKINLGKVEYGPRNAALDAAKRSWADYLCNIQVFS
jgi:hypothetical protein